MVSMSTRGLVKLFTMLYAGICGVQFDRVDIPINKLVAIPRTDNCHQTQLSAFKLV